LERKAMAMQENQRRAEERYASAIAKVCNIPSNRIMNQESVSVKLFFINL